MDGGAVRTFRDLRVWQASYDLCIDLYEASKKFPKDEQFALTSQMRRAAVSVSSNIAEGFGRRQPKDKEHFYVMAAGSATELESQLEIAKGLGYLTQDQFDDLLQQCLSCTRQLHALLKTHRS